MRQARRHFCSKILTRDERLMMENLYWWGVPSFFRCPINDKLDFSGKAPDLAFVGVPHSTGNGTTERDQHLGPRAVRNISARWRRTHLKFGLDPWAAGEIQDCGDVPLPEANNNEKCIERITDFYANLGECEIPVVSCGGDHSVTGGILQGLSKSKLTDGKEVSLVHLDAHTDTFHQLDHFLGAKKSAAHWASYLVTQGQVDAEKSIQLGIRGHPRSLDWLQPSYDLGYDVVTMDEFVESDKAGIIQRIQNRVKDNPIYITIDLDCFDPMLAPGVSNLEVCRGFFMDEVTSILRGLRGFNIIGGDVVCLMPTKDSPSQQTSHVAAATMFELCCLIMDRKVIANKI